MTRNVAALAALLLASSGCAPARARVAPEVTAAADGWAVSGANPRTWRSTLAFGPYRSGPVADGGTLGWSFEILGIGGVAKGQRPFAWELRGPRGVVQAECHERTFEGIAPFGIRIDAQGQRGDAALTCAFRPAEGDAAWALLIRATGAATPAWEGQLRSARGLVYTVRSSHALEGTPLPLGTPAAWMIERPGAPAAVVEALGPGKIWVPRGATDPDALAATGAALLLFQGPAAD